jgi:release factor glutamine methyltransferase
VHRPRSDTWLLADALRKESLRGSRVADLCSGSGALAIVAAREGASAVLAVDISRRSCLAVRINARLNHCTVATRRGDLLDALGGERFDVIVCNPPYVPAASDALPRHRSTTPLDGGRDGRTLIDRVCGGALRHLAPGGALLLVHSSVCGVQATRETLGRYGLIDEIVAHQSGPLGPVLARRARMLRERGLLDDRDEEDLVVIRGRAPGPRKPATGTSHCSAAGPALESRTHATRLSARRRV